MAVKTITVTHDAYDALKLLKESKESFSDTILRVAGKKSLKRFIGVLSPESAKRLEKVIKERRGEHKEMHLNNVKRVAHAFRQREWQLF